MTKPLFLFVGHSSSGKTTVANMLSEKNGFVQVESYTTRKPRFENEPGHIFVSEEEFKNLGELAAYTYYNCHHYGTTFEQLNKSDIYVIDVPGVKSLLEKLKNDNRPICVIYFDASVYNRVNRMIDRGDSDTMIVSRLLQDERDDWYRQLGSLVWYCNNIANKDVQLYRVDANNALDSVVELVLYYINLYTGD